MQLSQREMLEINERLLANQTEMEKLTFSIEHTNDPDLRRMLEHHRNIYHEHGQVMMNFLRGAAGR